MKKISLLALSFALVACGTTTPDETVKTTQDVAVETTSAVAASETVEITSGAYTLDTAASKMVWTGKKVGGSHYGTFPLLEGNLSVSETGITDGSFTLDIENFTIDDISGDSAQGLRDHMVDEDFFNIEEYPTAQFTIDSATAEMVTGMLTINDVTNEQMVPYTVEMTEDGMNVTGSFSISRKAYELSFGVGKDLGVNDEVEMDFELTFNAA